jgi:cob(I)alamin adenosyltransferase
LVKIYTKAGDKGETGLIGGKRVSKADPRIVAYGSIDELNSTIGVAISLLESKNQKLFSDLISVLVQIQNDLFIVGSDLADPNYSSESEHKTPRVNEKMASALEPVIDKFENELAPITYFILPGGSVEASFLHLSRSVARRAETAVVELAKSQTINPAIIIYLNRLSDLLFVAARLVNKRMNVKDIAWHA